MITEPHIQCLDSGGTNLLGVFDTTLAPDLLYYSYLPIILLSLALGLLVFYKRVGFTLPNKLLLLLSIFFSAHLFNEILQWITVPAPIVHFEWQMVTFSFLILSGILFYFIYSFVNNKDLPFAQKLALIGLLLPGIFLLPTQLNMTSFNLATCEADIGPLFVLYGYLVPFLIAGAIGIVCMRRYVQTRNAKNIYVMLGGISFLFFLAVSDYLGETMGNFEINLIGPIGMLIFLVILAYLIVKFKAFNIKMLATQALVAGLIILIGSQFLFVQSTVNLVLVGITLLLTLLGGYFLVRSVKKEVEQKEKIALLAEGLQEANERLKILDKMKSEFVSIASHQLRSPLTSIRGYASMLAEGSYGKLPAKAQEIVQSIAESSKYMALSVEDYLNVSRIESGNMKYEMSDFNLKELTEKVADEMRPVALKKGLVIMFRSDCSGSCAVHADVGKTRQVITNLIDNAMKYTQKGTITVEAHDDIKKKKIYIAIRDTGVGMSADTISDVFEKFVRAKNANSINVTGTGLGLYVAKKMVTAMGGHIWAESAGEGKGSVFTVEFSLVSGRMKR